MCNLQEAAGFQYCLLYHLHLLVIGNDMELRQQPRSGPEYSEVRSMLLALSDLGKLIALANPLVPVCVSSTQ